MSRKSGFKHTEETREKIRIARLGEKNPMFGRRSIMPEETKIKISEANKGRVHSEKSRKNMKGHTGVYVRTEEHKEKLRRNNARYWKGKKLPEKVVKQMSIRNKGKHFSSKTEFKKGNIIKKEIIEKIREARAKQVFPVKDTSIEIKIQNFLTKLHLEFYTHKYISEITHSYQCDIFIPIQKGIPQKTIIECDGCYWHGCPICFKKFSKLQEKQIEKDKIRTQELIEKGFRVIRLWEHNIKPIKINDFRTIIGGL